MLLRADFWDCHWNIVPAGNCVPCRRVWSIFVMLIFFPHLLSHCLSLTWAYVPHFSIQAYATAVGKFFDQLDVLKVAVLSRYRPNDLIFTITTDMESNNISSRLWRLKNIWPYLDLGTHSLNVRSPSWIHARIGQLLLFIEIKPDATHKWNLLCSSFTFEFGLLLQELAFLVDILRILLLCAGKRRLMPRALQWMW